MSTTLSVSNLERNHAIACLGFSENPTKLNPGINVRELLPVYRLNELPGSQPCLLRRGSRLHGMNPHREGRLQEVDTQADRAETPDVLQGLLLIGTSGEETMSLPVEGLPG